MHLSHSPAAATVADGAVTNEPGEVAQGHPPATGMHTPTNRLIRYPEVLATDVWTVALGYVMLGYFGFERFDQVRLVEGKMG